MMWHATSNTRYFSMGRRQLFLSLSDIRKDSETFYTRQFLDFFQTGTNLKHVQRSHKNRYVLRGFLLCRNCWRQKYEFLTIDKDSVSLENIEKDLMTLQYYNMVSYCQC